MPAVIFLLANTFSNSRTDFSESKPTKNQMFFPQNGLFCNNMVWLSKKHFLSLIFARLRKRLGTAGLRGSAENFLSPKEP
jgi:hypothetical protein